MRVIAPPTHIKVSMVKIVKVMAVAERLVCGVKSVLSDDFVKNSSQESQLAVKAANDMLEWNKIPATAIVLERFADTLAYCLGQCFKFGRWFS